MLDERTYNRGAAVRVGLGSYEPEPFGYTYRSVPRWIEGWPDEQIDQLRKLWGEGFSATQIAKQLNGVFNTHRTRNAVIGKVNRLGLCARQVPARPAKRSVRVMREKARSLGPVAPRFKPEPVKRSSIVPPPSRNVSLNDRKPFECAAVTDSTRFEQRYCAHPTKTGSAYCPDHDAMFINIQPRKGKAA